MPITPHPARPPAFPVFFESGWPPFPKSSIPVWTTTLRPIILLIPCKLITWSENFVTAAPLTERTFPRSPMWRTESFGAAWSTYIRNNYIIDNRNAINKYIRKWLHWNIENLIFSSNYIYTLCLDCNVILCSCIHLLDHLFHEYEIHVHHQKDQKCILQPIQLHCIQFVRMLHYHKLNLAH